MTDQQPDPTSGPPPGVEQRHRRRRWRALGVVVGTSVVAIVASATTTWGLVAFTDVPAPHPFRANITNVAGAGIAQGYVDGTYRPADPVTRQAMAAFLNRGLGRVGYGVQTVPVLTSYAYPAKAVTNVTVRSGAEGTGGGFVVLSADANAVMTTSAPDPRHILIWIRDQSTSQTSFVAKETVGPIAGDYRSISTQWVVALPAGQTHTYSLITQGLGFNQTIEVTGTLTAVYVPFGPDGTNALGVELPPPP